MHNVNVLWHSVCPGGCGGVCAMYILVPKEGKTKILWVSITYHPQSLGT